MPKRRKKNPIFPSEALLPLWVFLRGKWILGRIFLGSRNKEKKRNLGKTSLLSVGSERILGGNAGKGRNGQKKTQIPIIP